MSNLVGQYLGRYHILEQHGIGGMSTVYKAYDTRLDRHVAIKVIRKEAFSPEFFDSVLKRFEREAKALGRLSHPNIVNVYDYGEYEGAPYLVIEYIPGVTLKSHTGKPMAWSQAASLLLPVARALAYAHDQKIIHRDVKPSNILLTDSGEPMLSDFGIAKILEASGGTALTGSSMGIGTPEYMAPEQGLGTAVDARSDVYALGVVFYELVTGHKPFEADTPMAVMIKHITAPLPPPREFVPTLPDQVEQILTKALAKEPDQRFPDMHSFVRALEDSLRDAQVAARIPTQAGVVSTTTAPIVEKPVRTTAKAEQVRTQLLSEYERGHALPPGSKKAVPGSPKDQAQRPSQPRLRRTLWILAGLVAFIAVLCASVSGYYLFSYIRASRSTPTVTATPTRKIITLSPTSQATPTLTPSPIPSATCSPSPSPLPSSTATVATLSTATATATSTRIIILFTPTQPPTDTREPPTPEPPTNTPTPPPETNTPTAPPETNTPTAPP